MKELFKYVKDEILHGMPSGCLVTKDAVNFDVGMWQHKTYDVPVDIYGYLRSKWTPHTINLLIVDGTDDTTRNNLVKFIDVNSFETKWRSTYLVYCIAIKTICVTNELCHILKTKKYVFNSYHQKVIYGEYTIFVCDLIQNVLYY